MERKKPYCCAILVSMCVPYRPVSGSKLLLPVPCPIALSMTRSPASGVCNCESCHRVAMGRQDGSQGSLCSSSHYDLGLPTTTLVVRLGAAHPRRGSGAGSAVDQRRSLSLVRALFHTHIHEMLDSPVFFILAWIFDFRMLLLRCSSSRWRGPWVLGVVVLLGSG